MNLSQLASERTHIDCISGARIKLSPRMAQKWIRKADATTEARLR
jgi:hypothetical protein